MIIVAIGPNTDVTTKKTYIYKINFQCLADSIEEADACFAKEAQLTYSKKGLAGHLCPLITVEIIAPPKEGYGRIEVMASEELLAKYRRIMDSIHALGNIYNVHTAGGKGRYAAYQIIARLASELRAKLD